MHVYPEVLNIEDMSTNFPSFTVTTQSVKTWSVSKVRNCLSNKYIFFNDTSWVPT